VYDGQRQKAIKVWLSPRM